MTNSTRSFAILSATQQRVAALLSLAVTVAMLAANVGLVDHYAAQSVQIGNFAVTSAPTAGSDVAATSGPTTGAQARG